MSQDTKLQTQGFDILDCESLMGRLGCFGLLLGVDLSGKLVDGQLIVP